MPRLQGGLILVIAALLVALGGCSRSMPKEAAEAYENIQPKVRRISQAQYENTIAYIFGNDIQVGRSLAPLRRTDGLMALGASSVSMTSGEIQQLQRSAAMIASQVLDAGNLELRTPSRRHYLVPCEPRDIAHADDECSQTFFSSVGRLLFRRPVDEASLQAMVAEAHQSAEELGDFYAGLSTVLEGMLIDPKFLFIADITEPDPRHSNKRRLDAYSLASRLSFFLWNAGPDEPLLDAAERDDLHDQAKLARVVDAMLVNPRVEEGVRTFFDDMLGFEGFDNLAKDAAAYPMVTGATLNDAREQTMLTLVQQLLEERGDYRDLFTTRKTFMSPALATVYQVPAQPGWTPYEFPEDSPRQGVLSQMSFLALHSHPARSSPTLRGKSLREHLLCQVVPPPPPNVDFSALENPDGDFRTQRERVDFHLQEPACAGCHKITDPIGLALEHFDGAGRYRADELGAPIDASGNLDGKSFDDAVGLVQAVREHPALTSCLVRRMFSYGVGGPTRMAERPVLDYLHERFASSGYQVPALMREISLTFAMPLAAQAPPAVALLPGDAPTQASRSISAVTEGESR